MNRNTAQSIGTITLPSWRARSGQNGAKEGKHIASAHLVFNITSLAYHLSPDGYVDVHVALRDLVVFPGSSSDLYVYIPYQYDLADPADMVRGHGPGYTKLGGIPTSCSAWAYNTTTRFRATYPGGSIKNNSFSTADDIFVASVRYRAF